MKKSLKSSLILLMIVGFVVMLSACTASIEAGTYTATVPAYHGEFTVTTEIDEEGKITTIMVGDHEETKGIGDIAIEKIPKRIIEAQSLDVDVVSGATITGDAIISGVADALEQAGAKVADYGFVASTPDQEVKEEETAFNKEAMPVKKEVTGSTTVKDAKGREVTIDLPISSYAISTMDVIDYLIPLKGEEAFAMLVGSGQDGGGGLQKYEKIYKPIVGNYMEHVGQISDHNAPFDLEMILAMDPDVIFVNSAMGAHKYALEVEEQLNVAGISIVLIDVPGKELETSAQKTMTILGKALQEEEKAAEVVAFLDSQYELLASKNLVDRPDKPSVYYEKSAYSEVYGSTATSDSGWGLPIKLAGGDNIADELLLEGPAKKGGSNTLDPEYVIKADPDYIILSGINDGWLDSIKKEKTPCDFDVLKRTGWSDLSAVKNENVYEFAHSTSRSIFAFYPTLKMAKIFYPDEFKDLYPEAVLDEFFERFTLVDPSISTWMTVPADCQK